MTGRGRRAGSLKPKHAYKVKETAQRTSYLEGGGKAAEAEQGHSLGNAPGHGLVAVAPSLRRRVRQL